MTVPYAARFASCIEYTRSSVAERLKAGVAPTWERGNKDIDSAHTMYLAQLIWQAIGNRIGKAGEAMDWLRGLASTHAADCNRKGNPAPLEWRSTGSGFLCRTITALASGSA